MAVTQVFDGNGVPTPNATYVVIDCAAPGNYVGNGSTKGTLTAGGPGYDNALAGGATAQGVNTYKNGTIPDFLTSGTTSTVGVTFKNPVGRGN